MYYAFSGQKRYLNAHSCVSIEMHFPPIDSSCFLFNMPNLYRLKIIEDQLFILAGPD